MISIGVKMEGREQGESGADEGKEDVRRNWPKMKGSVYGSGEE